MWELARRKLRELRGWQWEAATERERHREAEKRARAELVSRIEKESGHVIAPLIGRCAGTRRARRRAVWTTRKCSVRPLSTMRALSRSREGREHRRFQRD
jgi:hypothetical protein